MRTNELKRYVPLAAWIIVVLTLFCIPSKIISYGYLPADDALRHAAKAVSGKPWQEILVMRSDFKIDPHPGWHATLGAIHHALNCGSEPLVLISIVGLMLLLSAFVLPRLRWPETWLASLLVVSIFVPRFINRLLLGRPYLFTIAVFLALIFIWFGLQNRRPRWSGIIASVILIALAAWIHGPWCSQASGVQRRGMVGRGSLVVSLAADLLAIPFSFSSNPSTTFSASLAITIWIANWSPSFFPPAVTLKWYCF
jgi:hypothetical protein